MLEAARSALDAFGDERPLLIAVTILTSFSQDDIQQLGWPPAARRIRRYSRSNGTKTRT